MTEVELERLVVRLVGDMSGYVDMLKRAQSETVATGKKIEGHTSMMGARAGMFMGRHLVRSLHLEVMAGDVGKTIEQSLGQVVMGGFMVSRAMKMGQALGGKLGAGIAGGIVGSVMAAGLFVSTVWKSMNPIFVAFEGLKARQSAAGAFHEVVTGAKTADQALSSVRVKELDEGFQKLTKHIAYWGLDTKLWAESIQGDVKTIVKRANEARENLKLMLKDPEYKAILTLEVDEKSQQKVVDKINELKMKIATLGMGPAETAQERMIQDLMNKGAGRSRGEAEGVLNPNDEKIVNAQMNYKRLRDEYLATTESTPETESLKKRVNAAKAAIDELRGTAAKWQEQKKWLLEFQAGETKESLDKARRQIEEQISSVGMTGPQAERRKRAFELMEKYKNLSEMTARGMVDKTMGTRGEDIAGDKLVERIKKENALIGLTKEQAEVAKAVADSGVKKGIAALSIDLLREGMIRRVNAALQDQKDFIAMGGGQLGKMLANIKAIGATKEQLWDVAKAFRETERLKPLDAVMESLEQARLPLDRMVQGGKDLVAVLNESKKATQEMTRHWITFGLEGSAAMLKWAKHLGAKDKDLADITERAKVMDRDEAGKLLESVRNPLDKFEEKFKHLQVLFKQGWFGKGAEGAAVFETVVKKVKDQMLGKEPEYKSPTAVSAQGAGGRAFLSDYIENFRSKKTTNVEELLKRIAMAVEKDNPPVVIKEAAI